MEEKMETKGKDSGSVSSEVFEQLDGVYAELGKEYFLKKLEEPNKKFRKKVTDMSGTALRVLLAAHRVWDLHYRHTPNAVHFYWKQDKANNKSLGENQVADIIFFDGKEERDCFFVEIVIIVECWPEPIARVRWCKLWKDRDELRWEQMRNNKSIFGETYISI